MTTGAKMTTSQRLSGISHLIGNTPLLEIECLYEGKRHKIFAKAENLNLTGSIKDRMALHIIKSAYSTAALSPGGMIIEATSGNTGISFSAIGRALGHPVTIFMPNWMSRERIDLIRSLGARIELVSKEQGGFLGSITMAEKLAEATPNAFLPRQFSNQDNAGAHFVSSGQEIWWQLYFHGLVPDALVAGVGTGGTIMGAGAFLRQKNPAIRLHPLEPSNSPTLSTGHKVGKHRIQGISDEFIPSIVRLDQLDEVISVDDGDAIIMAKKLATDLGLGVGISSGANFLGALMTKARMGPDAVVVTVLPDDNKKYLSTDLLRDEPVTPEFLSPRVNLLAYKAYKRVCHTCCVPEECEQRPGDVVRLQQEILPDCPRRSCSSDPMV